MTLVGFEDNSSLGTVRFNAGKEHLVSMMLSVQPQQQHYHHNRTPPVLHHLVPSPTSVVAHRGNVIVTLNNNNNNNNNNEDVEMKSSPVQQVHQNQCQSQQQQQTQQPTQGQKRKLSYTQASNFNGGASHQPASVARRNARERNRVKQVNNGFATLRQHIPQSLAQALGNNTAGTSGGARAGSKKLSKVETLRMAVEYIKNLQQLLDEHDAEVSTTSSGSSAAGSPLPNDSQSLGSAASIISDFEHQQQQAELKFELKSESGDDEHVQELLHQQQQHHQQQQQLHRNNHHHQHQHAGYKYAELKSENREDEHMKDLVHHQHQTHHHHHHHTHHQSHHLQHHPHQAQQQQQNRQSPVYIPNPSSEASSSPTPSFVSDASSVGGSQGYGNNFNSALYTPHPDGYESYDAMSPDDEELLDYISMWQH